MKLSNLKVAVRLSIGFAILLGIALAIGGIALSRLSHLDAVVNRMSTQDWNKARIAMEMQIRTRDNVAKSLRILLANGDTAVIEKIREEMEANSKQNGVDIKELEALVKGTDDEGLLTEAAEARENYNARRGNVMDMAIGIIIGAAFGKIVAA